MVGLVAAAKVVVGLVAVARFGCCGKAGLLWQVWLLHLQATPTRHALRLVASPFPFQAQQPALVSHGVSPQSPPADACTCCLRVICLLHMSAPAACCSCPFRQVAAQRLGVDPAACLVVEDRWGQDKRQRVKTAQGWWLPGKCSSLYHRVALRGRSTMQNSTAVNAPSLSILPPFPTLAANCSTIGLAAALGAGMRCLVTYTSSTRSQDFAGADAVVASLEGVGFAELAAGQLVGRDDRVAAAAASL